MRILFINLSLRPGAKRRILPVGLAYVMTSVQKAGFDFDLLDMDIDDFSISDAEEWLGLRSYDIYMFGCIVTGYRIVKELTAIIKKINHNAVVIAGNSVATSIPRLLLSTTGVDIAVLGEGDMTVVDLLTCLDSNTPYQDVSGIVFRDNGNICFAGKREVVADIDDFGFPDWDMFDLEKYEKFGQINYNAGETDPVVGYPLNSGRGCPYSCTFCYHVFKDVKYRRYSSQAITGEIKRLHNEHGADYISFWDELTFPDVKCVRALVDSLGDLDFKMGWEAPCRSGLFKKEDLELVKAMKSSGCDNISYSLENADPVILSKMNKRITVEAFLEQTETLWKGGVTPLTSVIFGYPQETPESIKMTIDVCEKCNIFPSVGFLLPLPGTPIYEWARKNQYIKNEVEYLERIGDRQDFHINLTKMSDEEFVDTVKTNLENLAERQGLDLASVFKTTTYQTPIQTENS